MCYGHKSVSTYPISGRLKLEIITKWKLENVHKTQQ